MLLNKNITYLDDSFREKIAPSALSFLKQLDGLSIFDIKGQDQTRTRVVTTLIHGNEPSGFIGILLWLKSNAVPATNIRIIICNPEAAKTKPKFTHRYIDNDKDLNRYFHANNSDQSEMANRARQICKAIHQVKPEAILDLHNTSGNSPAFAVAVREDNKTKDIVSLFTQKLILSGLKVGAIMENDFACPIATIECGGASEIESHQVAIEGLTAFFSKPNLFVNQTNVKVYYHPISVRLFDEVSVGFAQHQLPTTDITLRADIETLNQQRTPAGEFLGWCDDLPSVLLTAIDDNGNNQIDELFEVKNGRIFSKQNLHLFMVTTSVEIATNDCLFYVTRE